MSLPDLLQTIDQLKAEIDALRPLPTETEQRILQKFRLDWNYHSNAMEGNSLTQGETETFLMEGLTAKGKPLKDHLDIKGHNTAINFLLEFVRHPESPLTEANLRELHRILLVEPYRTPAETAEGLPTTKLIAIGEYKTGPNNVRTPTGEVHFYATPEETPAKMGDLMRWYREESQKGELHPVIIAAIFHHRFTAIHPFDDGNGRMSRLLMNLILMQRGYPPVVLQTYNRNEYLLALRTADQGEIEVFASLISTNLIRSLEIYLKGAKGESLDEPDDVDKQVALLKQKLRHVEAPKQLNQELQKEMLNEQILEFLEFLSKKISDFNELFAVQFITIEEIFTDGNHRSTGTKLQSNREGLLEFFKNHGNISPNKWVDTIIVRFLWKSFTKAYFNNFDMELGISIKFDRLKYTITILNKSLSFAELYQQQLSREEMAKIASSAKEFCLSQIESQLNKVQS